MTALELGHSASEDMLRKDDTIAIWMSADVCIASGHASYCTSGLSRPKRIHTETRPSPIRSNIFRAPLNRRRRLHRNQMNGSEPPRLAVLFCMPIPKTLPILCSTSLSWGTLKYWSSGRETKRLCTERRSSGTGSTALASWAPTAPTSHPRTLSWIKWS